MPFTHPAQTVSPLLLRHRRSRLFMHPRHSVVNPMGSATVVRVNDQVVQEGGEPRGVVGSVTAAINLAITPATVLDDLETGNPFRLHETFPLAAPSKSTFSLESELFLSTPPGLAMPEAPAVVQLARGLATSTVAVVTCLK